MQIYQKAVDNVSGSVFQLESTTIALFPVAEGV
jgi:hypothetical protein